MKIRVGEICVNQIRVNQALGVGPIKCEKIVCLLCDFKILLTVFNQSYNCQTSHYLSRNRLMNSFLILPSLTQPFVTDGNLVIHILTFEMTRWRRGVRKHPKNADVIYEWSLARDLIFTTRLCVSQTVYQAKFITVVWFHSYLWL